MWRLYLTNRTPPCPFASLLARQVLTVKFFFLCFTMADDSPATPTTGGDDEFGENDGYKVAAQVDLETLKVRSFIRVLAACAGFGFFLAWFFFVGLGGVVACPWCPSPWLACHKLVFACGDDVAGPVLPQGGWHGRYCGGNDFCWFPWNGRTKNAGHLREQSPVSWWVVVDRPGIVGAPARW